MAGRQAKWPLARGVNDFSQAHDHRKRPNSKAIVHSGSVLIWIFRGSRACVLRGWHEIAAWWYNYCKSGGFNSNVPYIVGSPSLNTVFPFWFDFTSKYTDAPGSSESSRSLLYWCSGMAYLKLVCPCLKAGIILAPIPFRKSIKRSFIGFIVASLALASASAFVAARF